MELDLENPLISSSLEFEEQQQPDIESRTIPHLFAAESHHMPCPTFLLRLQTSQFHASFRRQAISLILQAQHNLDPLISYLALNYMDRFISKHEIEEEKPWVLRLIAISCLSLASKMKTTPLSLSSLQREEGFIFDAQSIHKMELLILDALNWRMRSITPFSFLHFFISLLHLQTPMLAQALKDRASNIILKSHHEIKLLEFKPSIIAASALLSASDDLAPLQFPSFNTSIASCGYINQERLVQCFNAMQEIGSSTRTPMCVLECSGSKLERCETIATTKSMSGGGGNEKRESKRQKVSGLCSGTRFRISQIQQC